MTLKIETESGLKDVVRLFAVSQGRDRRVLRLSRVKSDLTLEPFYSDLPTLLAGVSPSELSFSSNENSTVSGVAQATVTGGMAPFTYLWVVISSTYPTTITSPTSATVTLRQTGVISGDSGSAEIQLTVQDSTGQSSIVNVIASFTNFGIA